MSIDDWGSHIKENKLREMKKRFIIAKHGLPSLKNYTHERCSHMNWTS